MAAAAPWGQEELAVCDSLLTRCRWQPGRSEIWAEQSRPPIAQKGFELQHLCLYMSGELSYDLILETLDQMKSLPCSYSAPTPFYKLLALPMIGSPSQNDPDATIVGTEESKSCGWAIAVLAVQF